MLTRLVALGQALFYVATGLWPVVSMRSFEKVTGPKKEDWLVKTFGLLITVVGLVVGLAGRRNRVTPEIALLGAGAAATLAGSDMIYVTNGQLRRVYLLDAAAEIALIAAWAIARPRPDRQN